MLEVDNVLLDLWPEESMVEETPGEDNNAAKSVVRLQQAKAFAADQACCAEE
jgi:hypothetical protein